MNLFYAPQSSLITVGLLIRDADILLGYLVRGKFCLSLSRFIEQPEGTLCLPACLALAAARVGDTGPISERKIVSVSPRLY